MEKRLLRLREVESRCGIKHTTIYRMMEKGTFPRAIKVGPKAVRWDSSAIDAWVEEQINSAKAVA